MRLHVCRALLAFLLWSLGLQALLALQQVLVKQRLQLDRLGVDGLILTTNNTGEGAHTACFCHSQLRHRRGDSLLSKLPGTSSPPCMQQQ